MTEYKLKMNHESSESFRNPFAVEHIKFRVDYSELIFVEGLFRFRTVLFKRAKNFHDYCMS